MICTRGQSKDTNNSPPQPLTYGRFLTMDVGYYWLLFGVIAGLLPLYLMIKTLLHVLNIDIGEMRRSRR
jgi:hypothetical protein